jgi:hypothetical protein
MTDRDYANLFWARKVNDESRIGLFGPTVRRFGPLPDCEALVRAGLLERRAPFFPYRLGGYWITAAGRRALQEQEALR